MNGATTRGLAALFVIVALVSCVESDDSGSTGITTPPPTDPTAPTTEPGPTVVATSGLGPTTSVAARACTEYVAVEDLPLMLCDKGDLVQSVQAEIALQLGSPVEADGFFGAATDAAVRDYQSSAGLVADGIVGPRTWNALFGSDLPPNGSTRGIGESWYGRPAQEAVDALSARGFVVVDYEVCSGSVAGGLVRQIIGGDGTIYDDSAGVTEAGAGVSIGEVIEVKVSSGSAC